jgi:hypothetical protein
MGHQSRQRSHLTSWPSPFICLKRYGGQMLADSLKFKHVYWVTPGHTGNEWLPLYYSWIRIRHCISVEKNKGSKYGTNMHTSLQINLELALIISLSSKKYLAPLYPFVIRTVTELHRSITQTKYLHFYEKQGRFLLDKHEREIWCVRNHITIEHAVLCMCL